MEKNYGLSNTEMEIMDYFWEQESGVSFKEIMDYFNGIKERNWKKQTMGTYLTKLQNMNLIDVDSNQKHYKYYSHYSKEEFIHNWTKKLVSNFFGNSIGNFMVAFSGGKNFTDKEIEEIKKLI